MSASVRYQPVKNQEGHSELGNGLSENANSKFSLLWKIANMIMAAFFILCAYVQLNDPDPLIWIPVYLVPAGLCIAIFISPSVTENQIWKISCTVALALILVLEIYTGVLLIEFIALENPLKYEEGREFGGLLIIIFWMAVCRFTTLGSNSPLKGSGNALLLITCIIALFPLVMWGSCFLDKLDHMEHCKEMFPGMLSSFKHS